MSKVGVFLARMQPFHNGHVAILEKMIKENEEILVLVGSADKVNKRNPIPANLRVEILEEWLERNCNTDWNVVALDDLTDETDNSLAWGTYLYTHIVEHIRQPDFTMYYSDGYEIITSWFFPFMLKDRIGLSLIARNTMVDGLSASEVRKVITSKDGNKLEELRKMLPEETFERIDLIKAYVEITDKICQ